MANIKNPACPLACEYVSREQAAVELGRSLRSVVRLNELGVLPVHRINGKCVRIHRADLERMKRELAEVQ